MRGGVEQILKYIHTYWHTQNLINVASGKILQPVFEKEIAIQEQLNHKNSDSSVIKIGMATTFCEHAFLPVMSDLRYAQSNGDAYLGCDDDGGEGHHHSVEHNNPEIEKGLHRERVGMLHSFLDRFAEVAEQ